MIETEDQDLRLLCIQLLCDLVKIYLKEDVNRDELSAGYALQKLAEVIHTKYLSSLNKYAINIKVSSMEK